MINLTLELFNAVPSKEPQSVCVDLENGLVITSEASWAFNNIKDYYTQHRLSGEALNKTFHKSWNKILESTRLELLVEQITHYISTYGSGFGDETYIPNEILNIEGLSLPLKTIKGYTDKEFVTKCLSLLESGVALKQETIEKVLTLLSGLGYTFNTVDNIKNKEASVIISDKYGIYPTDPVEALRYCVYKSTGDSLLIKNKETIEGIKDGSFNPENVFKTVGLERMSEVFNRFKPLFLAYKNKCGSTVNKISKLSKVRHKPLVQNPLNTITTTLLDASNKHWLENATVYNLFRVLNICRSRVKGQQDFVYRIRNGKSWTQTKSSKLNKELIESNYYTILKYMKEKFDLTDLSFYVPEYVKYSLPTSEKMYVGNIPTGTHFLGNKLAVGVYWENSWGANDIDLSGVNISGKIGWNASYNQKDSILYSGDTTNAPNGAVEYLYCKGSNIVPTMVQSNIFTGEHDCDYKIVIGSGDDVSKDYMMNPEKVMTEIKCKSIQKQTYLGLLQNLNDKNVFTLLNFGSGHARISGNGELSEIACRALVQQYNSSILLEELLVYLGAKKVDKLEDGVYNLSPDSLEKDTILSIFQ